MMEGPVITVMPFRGSRRVGPDMLNVSEAPVEPLVTVAVKGPVARTPPWLLSGVFCPVTPVIWTGNAQTSPAGKVSSIGVPFGITGAASAGVPNAAMIDVRIAVRRPPIEAALRMDITNSLRLVLVPCLGLGIDSLAGGAATFL